MAEEKHKENKSTHEMEKHDLPPLDVFAREYRSSEKSKVVPGALGFIAAAITAVSLFLVQNRNNIISYILGAVYDDRAPGFNIIKKKFGDLNSGFANSDSTRNREFLEILNKLLLRRDEIAGSTSKKSLEARLVRHDALIGYWKRAKRDNHLAWKIQEEIKLNIFDMPKSYQWRTLAMSAMAAVSVGTVVYAGAKWFMKAPDKADSEDGHSRPTSYVERLNAETSVAEQNSKNELELSV